MAGTDREKALDAALAQIERQFGKGAVMRMGERPNEPIEVIPTGSTALDVALGVGGLPRGRVVEVYGPESSGKTTLTLHAVADDAVGGIQLLPGYACGCVGRQWVERTAGLARRGDRQV